MTMDAIAAQAREIADEYHAYCAVEARPLDPTTWLYQIRPDILALRVQFDSRTGAESALFWQAFWNAYHLIRAVSA